MMKKCPSTVPVPALLFFLFTLFPTLSNAQKTALDYAHEVAGKWEDGTGSVLEFEITTYTDQGDYCFLKVLRFELMQWSSLEKKLVKNVIEPRYFNSQYSTMISSTSAKPVVSSRNVVTGPKDPNTGKRPEKTLYTYGHELTSSDRRPCAIITTLEMSEVVWTFDYQNGILIGSPDYENPGSVFRRTKKDGKTNTERETAFQLSASEKEIAADGQTQVLIKAKLYDFISGQEMSSRPISGKWIEFDILPLEGVTPGTLSSAGAITNADGEATVTFVAPDAESLAKITNYSRKYATIMARSTEADHEELVSIYFKSGNGKIFTHPSAGIGSSHGLIPPDKRYPALIEAYFEDENDTPLAHATVTFTIVAETPLGILRNFSGQEGKTVTANTDEKGFARVHYCYNSSSFPDKPISENIHVISETASISMTATVSVGLNLVFELVESAYEGKGLINAGENIPLRVKIKDIWNPEADLSEIINYWGIGEKAGNDMLFVKLEIEKLGSVPDYLLDYLQIEKYPEEKFSDFMMVRSFKKEGQMNMLWMSSASFADYQGYPRISPKVSGKSYYEARISLTDRHGNDVFPSKHPATKAFLTMESGIEADRFKIFVNLNPFAPQTKNQQILREALSYKYGTVVSITDAVDAINRGDVDKLYHLLFGEIKSAILNQVSNFSDYTQKAAETYTQLALAEKVQYDIIHNESGPLAQMDNDVYVQLKSAFNNIPGQLIILSGDGNQQLLLEKAQQENKTNSKIKFSFGGFDDKTKESFSKIEKAFKKKGKEVTVMEGEFVFDDELKTYSLKKGNITYYLIPEGSTFSFENAHGAKQF